MKIKNLKKLLPNIPFIRASAPADNQLIASAGDFIQIEAAAADSEKLPKVKSGQLYSGGTIKQYWSPYPVVVNLAGMKIPESVPLLAEHRNAIEARLGDVTVVSDGKTLQITGGAITSTGKLAKEVVAQAKAGAQWQQSMGADPEGREIIPAGQTLKANDREFPGPVMHVFASTLLEATIIPVGADKQTNIDIAAKFNPSTGENPMNPKIKAYVIAKWSLDPNSTDQQVLAKLVNLNLTEDNIKAMMPPETPAGDNGEKPAGTAPAPVQAAAVVAGQPAPAAGAPPAAIPFPAPVQAAAPLTMDEYNRLESIKEICKDYPKIRAEAINHNWTIDKVQLEVVRAGRPDPGLNIIVPRENRATDLVIEAAIRMSGIEGMTVIEAAYDEPTLDAASKIHVSGIKSLLALCAQAAGAPVPTLHAAHSEWLLTAASLHNVGGIISNIGNKVAMAAYNQVPGVAHIISKTLSAKDFKTNTGYMMAANGTLQSVGADGEFPAVSLQETGFTWAVNTKGAELTINRQTLINDDLGMLLEGPQIIGQQARIQVEVDFFDMINKDTTFFVTDNANIDTSGAAVNAAGYALMEALFDAMVDANNNKILVDAKYILTPSALFTDAKVMYDSSKVILLESKASASASKVKGDANIYGGMYEPVKGRHLSSASNWYGVADPAVCAAFGIAWLRGKQGPVVEEVPMPSAYGRKWIIYIDYGVTKHDKHGAVKMTSAG